ncbi:cobalt ECF transporter T component CbiQ [Vibrio gazogenes]|uniref:Cobalt/nickel transport system permease protein n=1 Tax=Vibrio gazogenes DSM 21264 = NBRC 103151 TaxID=1123492 RepID=A0A1M4UTD9_VIBGA|nr:cobalt ECF transporter T component CbiQ [Vibrio gazogenes]USP15681.1 cobalt ECF transporter T component CbiQ [Vibrio gazogenes]SHE60021.1 cobalt/nickel transport system permease protein [Vibrio gazogenes DSM 21264] [Vibrio gazogenes DSM 21264 = NBRC 103151]SJN56151.1 Cobalt transport protein CbiQ [Vibrio gazogenes]
MLLIDKYAYRSRWVHVPPVYKGWFYLVTLILALTLPVVYQWGLFLLLMLLTCVGGRITLRQYLRWLRLPAGFLLFSIIAMVLTYHQQPDGLIISLPVADGFFGVSRELWGMAEQTLIRCLCSIAATYCFVVSTPFNQCIRLLKATRLPMVLVEQMLLTYRFIFILIEEAHAIFTAQTLRFGYIRRRNWLKSLAQLAAMLLQRVLVRHQQMKASLFVKLYQGEFL